MTESVTAVVASEAAVSQIMAAIRRLARNRAQTTDEVVVFDNCRMPDILHGVLWEITPLLESFTRGEARAVLDVLVGQMKIKLTKDAAHDLYTLKVCSQNSV